MRRLASLVAIPHPDEDIRRRGRNVVVLSLGLIGLDVLLIVLWVFQRENPSLVAGAIALVLFGVAIAIARRGWVGPAALLLIGVLMLAVLSVIAANNALSDTPYFLLIPVSIAGLVLSAWQVWPVFFANVIGLGLVTALIARTTPLSYSDVQVLQDSLAVLTIMGLISFLGASSTTRALRAAQTAREQAEAAATELDQANAALEMRVAERTTELAGALAAQRNQATELQISLDRQQTLNELLNALSLPIIPVREDVLVAPLVGNLDAVRAQRLIGDVLEQIERWRARAIILDVTGVAVVDTQLAQALLRTAEATRLLGARTILVGIRPEVAQTLVSLGADLSSLHTAATLQDGLATLSIVKS
jgi:rsbT co-antagonist protein RsbR